MFDIEMQEFTQEFFNCWKAAGNHITKLLDGKVFWLKADPYPPFLEHLSLRIGNQLFFIRLEDVDNKISGPCSIKGLLTIADSCNGHACIMPMKYINGEWKPELPEWGLINARDGSIVEPGKLVTFENIEMTFWETHDFAVQVVRDQIKKEGYEIMSSQGNPNVDPSIWFVGDSQKPEWVVVRPCRKMRGDVDLPDNITTIAAQCAKTSQIGYFASVAIASSDDEFDPMRENLSAPLFRGHRLITKHIVLKPISF